jgi:tRNA(Ile)-lysidine synthase TilS/MesJ
VSIPPEVYDHYSKWEEEQAGVLTSLRNKLVWVLFSGGKDSSLSLLLLHAASEAFGFRFEAHAGLFPHHRYTPSEIERIGEFWQERGIQIKWHHVDMPDNSLATADDPCAVCQEARKRLLNNVVQGNVTDLSKLVLVTAYTLSDLVSYSLEHLMGASYSNNDPKQIQKSRQRFLQTGQRFYPILKMDRGFTVYRPVLRFNSQGVIDILDKAGVPILSTRCKYAHFRPKRILEAYYDSMSLLFNYDRVLEFASQVLGLPSMDKYASMNNEHFLRHVF